MPNYILSKRETVYWDGNLDTASEFGWGDFTYSELVEIETFEAKDLEEAKKISRKICRGKKIRCSFNKKIICPVHLEEIKK